MAMVDLEMLNALGIDGSRASIGFEYRKDKGFKANRYGVLKLTTPLAEVGKGKSYPSLTGVEYEMTRFVLRDVDIQTGISSKTTPSNMMSSGNVGTSSNNTTGNVYSFDLKSGRAAAFVASETMVEDLAEYYYDVAMKGDGDSLLVVLGTNSDKWTFSREIMDQVADRLQDESLYPDQEALYGVVRHALYRHLMVAPSVRFVDTENHQLIAEFEMDQIREELGKRGLGGLNLETFFYAHQRSKGFGFIGFEAAPILVDFDGVAIDLQGDGVWDLVTNVSMTNYPDPVTGYVSPSIYNLGASNFNLNGSSSRLMSSAQEAVDSSAIFDNTFVINIDLKSVQMPIRGNLLSVFEPLGVDVQMKVKALNQTDGSSGFLTNLSVALPADNISIDQAIVIAERMADILERGDGVDIRLAELKVNTPLSEDQSQRIRQLASNSNNEINIVVPNVAFLETLAGAPGLAATAAGVSIPAGTSQSDYGTVFANTGIDQFQFDMDASLPLNHLIAIAQYAQAKKAFAPTGKVFGEQDVHNLLDTFINHETASSTDNPYITAQAVKDNPDAIAGVVNFMNVPRDSENLEAKRDFYMSSPSPLAMQVYAVLSGEAYGNQNLTMGLLYAEEHRDPTENQEAVAALGRLADTELMKAPILHLLDSAIRGPVTDTQKKLGYAMERFAPSSIQGLSAALQKMQEGSASEGQKDIVARYASLGFGIVDPSEVLANKSFGRLANLMHDAAVDYEQEPGKRIAQSARAILGVDLSSNTDAQEDMRRVLTPIFWTEYTSTAP